MSKPSIPTTEKETAAPEEDSKQPKFITCSINELRKMYGLEPLDDPHFNDQYLIERDLIFSGFRV